MGYPFINKTNNKESRYNSLMYAANTILTNGSGTLQIEINGRFDFDIIRGSNYYLTNESDFGEISGLLFIPTDIPYIPKSVNKDLLLWSDTRKDSNLMIALNVYPKGGNRWEVKIDSKNIPLNLLPQQAGSIELPVKFVTKNNITSGDLILFEINLNVNGSINTTKPLIAIQKLDEKINDYFDVINILQSIQTPISKNVFININKIDPPGFTIGDRHYYLTAFNNPMNVMVV